MAKIFKAVSSATGRPRKHPLETIAEIYATGVSATGVGQLLGLHHTTVIYALQQMGVERRKSGNSRPGMTAKRLARIARDERIKRLYLAGHPQQSIAMCVNLHPNRVSRILKREDTPIRPRGTRHPKRGALTTGMKQEEMKKEGFVDYRRYRTEYRKAKKIERMLEIALRRKDWAA